MTSRAEMEARAADFILRQGETEWSREDDDELAAWLAASTSHRVAFLRLRHGWKMVDRLRSTRCRTSPVHVPAIRAYHALAVAASLLIAIGIQLWLLQHGPQPYVARFDTAVGGRSAVKLPDGSKIDLNTNTHIRVNFAASRRVVWVDDGEAYFQVAHDANHPFVIHLGSRDVTVLGTKFGIRREKDRLTVAVSQGRVQLAESSGDSGAAPMLLRGGDLVVSQGTTTILRSNVAGLVDRALEWRQGLVVFENSRLVDILNELSRYDRRKIVITDPEAANIRLTISLQMSNVDAFVRLLQSVYGIDAEIIADEQKIVIGRATDS